MQYALSETARRRKIQNAYNEAHGITPKTVRKDIRDIIEISSKEELEGEKRKLNKKERLALIQKLEKEMREAAKLLEFEHAAYLRDKIAELCTEK